MGEGRPSPLLQQRQELHWLSMGRREIRVLLRPPGRDVGVVGLLLPPVLQPDGVIRLHHIVEVRGQDRASLRAAGARVIDDRAGLVQGHVPPDAVLGPRPDRPDRGAGRGGGRNRRRHRRRRTGGFGRRGGTRPPRRVGFGGIIEETDAGDRVRLYTIIGVVPIAGMMLCI
jgi:hypothetical protein